MSHPRKIAQLTSTRVATALAAPAANDLVMSSEAAPVRTASTTGFDWVNRCRGDARTRGGRGGITVTARKPSARLRI